MKRTVTLTMLFVFLLSLSGLFVGAQETPLTDESAGVYRVVSMRAANLRLAANTRATVIASVAHGQELNILRQVTGELFDGSDVWYVVLYDDEELFVHESLVRVVTLAQPEAAATEEVLTAQGATRTANPNAMPEAQAILTFLYELPSLDENRVISGQFGAYGDGTSRDTAEAQLQAIYDQTGLWPAFTGMDYKRWDRSAANDFTEPNSFLIDQWNQGALVNLSWHASNPWTRGSANDWENTDTEDPWDTRPVGELTRTGSEAHEEYMLMLDDIAVGLQELEDAGVVVIWRPFHEMNGGWAWWHRQSAEDFTALWRHMFDYFTNEKGLDNLLWAYSPNANHTEWDLSPTFHYPGDAYVDIVGIDKYMGIDEDPLALNDWGEYDALVATGKPVALFEFGPLPATGQGWDTVRYDYANLIRDIKRYYPRIVLFQAWEYVWQIGRHDNAEGLFNDPWVITRDEMPNWVELSEAD